MIKVRLSDDDIETNSSEVQLECEDECSHYLNPYESLSEPMLENLRKLGVLSPNSFDVNLLREKHASYVLNGMNHLSSGWAGLDASRPWLCFWSLHSLSLLDKIPSDIPPRIISSLKQCQNARTGGFGGGFMQLAHCAPSYAAICALLTTGLKEAYEIIDRKALYRFLLSMKQKNGGFSMHHGGEVDVRATYAALASAAMCNILTPELTINAKIYILSCQTCEGGFGGEPGNEAHGGYAFCAFASLLILGEGHEANIDALEYWNVNRQMSFEGGFQGRTNKLVDGCYSYWQGAIPALIALQKGDGVEKPKLGLGGRILPGVSTDASVNYEYLQSYILNCCQAVEGGLRDKPSKSKDYYHTCYCLSGLSVAQHFSSSKAAFVFGSTSNLLHKTDPIYNVRADMLEKSKEYFSTLACSHDALL